VTIRVLIADDEHMVREGFRLLLETQPDIRVVGEAASGAAAIDAAATHRPDVVLMDIRMPGMDGLQATRAILSRMSQPPRIVMLTTFDFDEYVYDAIKAGASGFLLKESPPEKLAEAVRVVARGDALLHPSITRRLIADLARRPTPRTGLPPAMSELTPRELDVLRLVARGRSNGEIAAELHLGEATIKTHLAHLLAKLRLRDRVQAVVMAYESGLVEPGQD
jgi:DNA-binding NarL/FixJ family response regulator